ncbi:hypothetical protein V5E97_00120 [Singulisphaera sp. Ch08]|uniref:Uncharacterized protein n=1 Tax=Singulisphaera sp. Ch08 TaxID=3120278 RepID=A0AAU7CHD8_9BACT
MLVEEPYALIRFDYLNSRGVILFGLKAVCNVLDYVGQSADCLVVFARSMGESRVIEPFRGPLPVHDLFDPDQDDGGEAELSRIVRFIERQVKGGE